MKVDNISNPDVYNTVKDSVTCPICMDILEDSAICNDCEQMQCSSCTLDLNACPNCYSINPMQIYNGKITNRLLDKLKFQCPQKEHGCTDTPIYSDQKQNVEKCFTCETCKSKIFDDHSSLKCKDNLIINIMTKFTRLLSNVNKFKNDILKFNESEDKLKYVMNDQEDKEKINHEHPAFFDHPTIIGAIEQDNINKTIIHNGNKKQSRILFDKRLEKGIHTIEFKMNKIYEGNFKGQFGLKKEINDKDDSLQYSLDGNEYNNEHNKDQFNDKKDQTTISNDIIKLIINKNKNNVFVQKNNELVSQSRDNALKKEDVQFQVGLYRPTSIKILNQNQKII